MDNVRGNDLAHSLGIRDLTYLGENGPGGAAPCAMVGQAVAAILAGQATTVLVFRSLNGRSGVRFGQSPVEGASVGGAGSYDELFAPYGLLTPGQIFALMAQRHMIEFGTTPEQLGGIAARLPGAGERQPGGADARPAADDGRLPRGAHDRRAAAPVRLLPRDRRCVRGRRHQPPSGPPTWPSHRRSSVPSPRAASPTRSPASSSRC